jgi:hypothetical protein
MSLGQIINFDNNEYNTLFQFFFETNQLNAKGETFDQILQSGISDNGLKLNKDDAEVAVKYMDQTMSSKMHC